MDEKLIIELVKEDFKDEVEEVDLTKEALLT